MKTIGTAMFAETVTTIMIMNRMTLIVIETVITFKLMKKFDDMSQSK